MLKGEVSVATMGFFAKNYNAKKLIALVGMVPVELMYGFQFVKYVILKNPLKASTPNSWKLDQEMRATGVFDVDPIENLDQIVFKGYFDVFAIQEYVFKKVQKSKLVEKSSPKKAKKPATAPQKEAPSKQKASASKEKKRPLSSHKFEGKKERQRRRYSLYIKRM